MLDTSWDGGEMTALEAGLTVFGYSLWDEPDAPHFPLIHNITQQVRLARPTKANFVNLLPNYAEPLAYGAIFDHFRSFFIISPSVSIVFHHFSMSC